MLIQARVAAELQTAEGLALRPYWCPSGWLTIGYGHNLGVWAAVETQARVRISNRQIITLDEAASLLKTDIDVAMKAAGKYVPLQPLCAARRVVLVCMAFQLGWHGLFGFRRLRACILAEDWEGAYLEMVDSKWAREDSAARALRYARTMLSGRMEDLDP